MKLLKAKKTDVHDCAMRLDQFRDFLGGVKEILYAILTWPFLCLVNGEYTTLTRAAHKAYHHPTFRHHAPAQKAKVHHMCHRLQRAHTSERLQFPGSNRY